MLLIKARKLLRLVKRAFPGRWRLDQWGSTSISWRSRITGYGWIGLGPGSILKPRCHLDADTLTSRISLGRECVIHQYAMLLTYGGTIEIGDHCSVNPFCILYGHGGLKIGDKVRIAAHTVMIPAEHGHSALDSPIMDQEMTGKGIVVGDDVWIGTGACILDGVTIGGGAIVGAGAVVTRDVEPYAVVAGTPARKLKSRL